MITIKHNIDSKRFLTLWAKYVRTPNILQHCQNCIHGPYSKKFGLKNPNFNNETTMTFDETDNYQAIYFCGISKKEASKEMVHPHNPNIVMKRNYLHNLHFAIIPHEGAKDVWDFEEWHVEIEGGYLTRIPEEEEIPEKYKQGIYDDHYYTCRIFRWMLGFFYLHEIVK
ncbi:MAG: hypothetical protein IKX43_00270 [Paludibacteraceae bacterium]|jgi:hypothetical protein|nr:hypothetical protein [Paludibacteraceae bacterium]MBR5694656.1 hypothetical protein [Paludibacteraceae bacterium]